MNILLSSAGRRPYLVRWFKEALTSNSVEGQVIATDVDPAAPARAFADTFLLAPRVDDPVYAGWLADALVEHDVDLAVSINDFELSVWAGLPTCDVWSKLVRLTPETQEMVEDKYAMSLALDRFGATAPRTWLGSQAAEGLDAGGPFVTKGRFGSASRGLRFADAAGLTDAVAEATREVTTRHGVAAYSQDEVAPEDLVVVQQEIKGVEYGLDVVCDLDSNFAGVLVRRKITMRSGETDRAVSVDPAAFEDVARAVALAVPHPGTFDVDIIVDEQGAPFVIDINPRFGGGYPFSHLAGADVPSAYVAWRRGQGFNPQWLAYDAGVVAGKFVEIASVGQEDDL